jgi:hypothetical protein
MIRKVMLGIGMVITLICAGICSYIIIGAVLQGDRSGGECTAPPKPFQKSDLAGTWVAKYGGGATDTLILKEDGIYKQIFDDPIPAYHYESDWQKWWLEYGGSGIPHLYMQRMRKCDGLSEDCRRESGGSGDRLWLDFCEHRVIQMPPGGVILLVTGLPEGYTQPPRGILLRQLVNDSDATGGTFQLQEL